MIRLATDPALHVVFDAAAWLSGIAVGVALYRWRLSETTLAIARVTGRGYFFALAIGAVVGAYLSGTLGNWQGSFVSISHSILGALVGGIAAVEIYKLARGIRISTGIIFVGPFATGVMIGRWGCLFSGLSDGTYGTPTSLPFAVDLGDGIARHPVQVYESLSAAIFLALFVAGLSQRATWAMRDGFYWLAIWYGAQRFLWEFLKPYPTLLGPFNLFHLLSAGLVIYGIVMVRRSARLQFVA